MDSDEIEEQFNNSETRIPNASELDFLSDTDEYQCWRTITMMLMMILGSFLFLYFFPIEITTP